MDIYAASEPPIEGVTSQALAGKIQAFGHRGVTYTPTMEEGIASVVHAASTGDAIVTLGAGSVSQAGDKILAILRSNNGSNN
jgi:UDP-N-acetylmuramate--alanine ligase